MKNMKKIAVTALIVTALSALTIVIASATGTGNQTSAELLQSMFNTVVNDMRGVIGVVLAGVVGIFALIIGVRFGIKFFKSMVSKA